MTGRPSWKAQAASRTGATPNDILGNWTNRKYTESDPSSWGYDWDVLNRMTKHANKANGISNRYRADGQRVEKVEGATLLWTPTGSRGSGFYDTNYATNRPTSRYFYDGQMGFEDDYNPSGSVTTINRYGLGARGIDRIENYASSTTTYGYPLYDGHGSMRAVLTKSGSTYATGNWRTYDVWGSVRSGSSTGDPKQRYVANLGHVSDDESGLIYMRARYYEPSTGRFISEDPARDGWNWFVYCGNEPLQMVDSSGGTFHPFFQILDQIGLSALRNLTLKLKEDMARCASAAMVGAAGITMLVAWYGLGKWATNMSSVDGGIGIMFVSFLAMLQGLVIDGASPSSEMTLSVGEKARATISAYACVLGLFMGLEVAFSWIDDRLRVLGWR